MSNWLVICGDLPPKEFTQTVSSPALETSDPRVKRQNVVERSLVLSNIEEIEKSVNEILMHEQEPVFTSIVSNLTSVLFLGWVNQQPPT
jgi:hypothetical protein